MLICVDDILDTSNATSLVQQLISKLNSTFALKQLGSLDYFLGIMVRSAPTGSLVLSQSKYIKDLLHKANMHEAKALSLLW